jgi:hypothetical protein
MFEIRIATLPYRRLGYARLLNGEGRRLFISMKTAGYSAHLFSTMQQEPCASG